MRARRLTRSRWFLVPAGLIAIVLFAGCGRVDLQDLTPEAFQTQQAQEAQNQPTPTEDTGGVEGTAAPGETAPAGGGGGADLPEGDVAAGDAIYNSQCSGCHEGGRAASLRGKVFDPAEMIPKLRTEGAFGVPHPVYKPTDIRPLNDNDLTDVFAYLARQ